MNVLRSIEVSNTLLRTWSRRAVAYADHEDPMEAIASAILEVCGDKCRIGVENESFFVSARRFRMLRDYLARFATTVIECQIVDPLRMVKSAEEMIHVRSAARISEQAMEAAIATAAEGVSENEIAAATWSALERFPLDLDHCR